MPRPRKPTNVLAFSGAFAKNPARGRARANEPKANGPIGAPPSELNEFERKAWIRIVSECPAGVLQLRDRQAVLCAALLGGALIQGHRDPKIINAYRVAISELGMTPAASSKVTAKLDDEEEKQKSIAAV